jgi:hypothetical protein
LYREGKAAALLSQLYLVVRSLTISTGEIKIVLKCGDTA